MVCHLSVLACIGMPALTVLLALAAMGNIYNFFRGHSGIADEVRHENEDHDTKYISFEARRLSEGISTLSKRMLKSGKKKTQTVVVHEKRQDLPHVRGSSGHDENVERHHVLLVIAVQSVRPDRRLAIRETWSKWADDRVVLRFFTEAPNAQSHEELAAITGESRSYGDLITQDIGRGMNFGLKLLWSMRWMSDHYSFDFFIRLDDDYFLCLERLLDELSCLQESKHRPAPIYAGYRACRKDHKSCYIDESYILLSSILVDRVLGVSDLMCSGYGSLTLGAWLRVGGPGNPEGDVSFVNDYRLDRWGRWWKNSDNDRAKSSEKNSVCERNLGIHRTYAEHMFDLWVDASVKTNGSQSVVRGCESSFHYEDDGQCPFVASGVTDAYLETDNVQPCGSFTALGDDIYCGGQGC